MMEKQSNRKNESLTFSGGGSGAPPTEQGHLSVAVQLGMHGRNVAVACRLSERGLAAKSAFGEIGGGGVSPGVGGGCILTGECLYIST